MIILINKISRHNCPSKHFSWNEWVVIIFENILIDFVILPDSLRNIRRNCFKYSIQIQLSNVFLYQGPMIRWGLVQRQVDDEWLNHRNRWRQSLVFWTKLNNIKCSLIALIEIRLFLLPFLHHFDMIFPEKSEVERSFLFSWWSCNTAYCWHLLCNPRKAWTYVVQPQRSMEFGVKKLAA